MQHQESNILTRGEETSGWPWGYGTFAIITPVITIPILVILYLNQRKALRDGLLVKEKSGRTLWQSVNFYFWEFDGQSTSRETRLVTDLIMCSHWAPACLRGICPLPIAVLSPHLPVKGMGFRNDHRNACHWHSVLDRLRFLWKISSKEIFHSILPTEDSLGDRCMLVGNVPVHQLLVSCAFLEIPL